MSNFFLNIYRFFHYHRAAFYLFLVICLAFIAFFASRIKLEEDISGFVSGGKSGTDLDHVLRHFKFAEKLIITIFPADTNVRPDISAITAFADEFVNSLNKRFDSTYIRSRLVRVTDTNMAFYYNLLYEHLPLYLDDRDYEKIDTLISPESVASSLKRNYKSLVSPASVALKKMILGDPVGLMSLALNKLKTLQAGENFEIVNGYVMTSDKKNLLIFITPANPPNETSKNAELVKGIDQILTDLGQKYQSKVKGEYFGAIAMAVGNARQLKKDILLTISIALFLIILLIGWYFRSIKIPLLSFMPALFGGGFALAILFLTKGHVSAIALGIGSVILGLIVDYALYFINHYRKKGSIEVVIKDMSLTIFLCCLTSAGAFLCLVFLRSAVLHDLGWFAALSVAGAALFTLVVLPHFLTGKDALQKEKRRITFVDRLAEFPFEKKYWIPALFIIFGIVSFFYMSRAGFENDMSSMNYVTDELKQAEKDLDRITTVSLKNIYIVSTGKDLEEALLQQEKLKDRIRVLRDSSLVRQYSGPGNLLLSGSAQDQRIRKWNQYWTEGKKRKLKETIIREGGQYKFKESAFSSFFALLDKNFAPLDRFSADKIKNDLLSEWINDTDGMVMVSSVAKVKEEDKVAVYKAFSGVTGTLVFDRQYLTDRFIASVKHDFKLLVKLSMIFVTFLLLLSFGRIETGLATSLPMFFSWLITLGFMGVTGIRFNIFNIIISSFIFGLGVDYSILMMRGLMHEYKFGTQEISSFKISIFLSSATTMFGVVALFFAKHPALNSIALISVVGIISVVLISYIFQPLMVSRALSDQLNRKKFPVTARIFIKTFITWGNIVLIAILMVILGGIIFIFFPLPRKKKEYLFHKLFSLLCKAYIFVTFPTNGKLYNPLGEDFQKPAIIISNHQSLIETPAFLRLYPKILILTNEWVWNSPLFGPIARMASYFNAEHGIDSIMDKLREKVEEGYSILVFPEAHRSEDHNIQRFHRGAFYLAEKLKIDILPVLVFGSGDFLPRGAFWGRPNALRMKILHRVSCDDLSFGKNYSERTRQFRKFYIEKYRQFKSEEGSPEYYRKRLILNYVFKGPVLEWYLRIKMKLENNYEIYHRFIPKKGEILDLGCGYGFITYMLKFTSDERNLAGIDYDPDKIAVANNCFSKDSRITFECAELQDYPITPKDGFVLSDVLHYMPPEKQEQLLRKCLENLKPDGIILIREGNCELKERHLGTRVTEFFSTHIGFNKTADESRRLYFTSAEKIRAVVSGFGLELEIIDNKKVTSNTFYIIRKPLNIAPGRI